MFDGSLDEGNLGGVEGLGRHGELFVLGAIVDRIQEVIIFIPMTEALVSGTDGGSCHERRVEAEITELINS